MAGNAELACLLSSILWVIHLELFRMGMEGMKKLQTHSSFSHIYRFWWSIYNGVQVISNRESLVHRDHSSSSEWYDLLTTVGPYSDAVLELPGVGLCLQYNSGTVMALCGHLLRHGVFEAEGERICLAYYMRENVQRRLGVKFATWSKWNKILHV